MSISVHYTDFNRPPEVILLAFFLFKITFLPIKEIILNLWRMFAFFWDFYLFQFVLFLKQDCLIQN